MEQLQLELDAFTVDMLVYRKFLLSKFTRFHKLLKILETPREPFKFKITRFPQLSHRSQNQVNSAPSVGYKPDLALGGVTNLHFWWGPQHRGPYILTN